MTPDTEPALHAESVQSMSHASESDDGSYSSRMNYGLFATLGTNKLFGQDKELRILQHAIDSLFRQSGSRTRPLGRPETHQTSLPSPKLPTTALSNPLAASCRTMVLLSGPTGIGKSSLAMSFEQQCFERHGFFVSCSFTLRDMDEPFSGIRTALDQLCQQILHLPRFDSCSNTSADSTNQSRDPRSFDEVSEVLSQTLSSDEVDILSDVLPSICAIVNPNSAANSHQLSVGDKNPHPEQHETEQVPSVTTITSAATVARKKADRRFKERSEGLKFVLRRFVQIVCGCHPLVVFVDNLQWADQASLDLIHSWMMDSNNSAFMVIGCCRSGSGEQRGTTLAGSAELLDVDNCDEIDDDNETTNGSKTDASQASRDDPLSRVMETLKASRQSRCIRLIQIDIKPLTRSAVSDLLRSVLTIQQQKQDPQSDQINDSCPDSNALEDLAHIVHAKTGGNPYFIQQLLQILAQQRHLTFDPRSMQWRWNADEIRQSIAFSVTTAHHVTLCRLKQSSHALYILPIAACLGAMFSKATLMAVIRALLIHSDHGSFTRELFGITGSIGQFLHEDMEAAFRTCLKEGFIVAVARHRLLQSVAKCEGSRTSKAVHTTTKARGGLTRPRRSSKNSAHPFDSKTSGRSKDKGASRDMLTFAHDRIQEAAQSLIPTTLFSELQFRVGEVLMSIYSQAELGARVFTVVRLLNERYADLCSGSYREDARRIQIAALNYSAGMKSIQYAAFVPGLSYFRKAMGLLPCKHWENHLDLSVDIYSAAAECAYLTSQPKLMQRYCEAVLTSKCLLLQKVRAHHLLMDASSILVTDHPVADPAKMGFAVLQQLNCRLPKSRLGCIWAIVSGLARLKAQASRWNECTFQDMQLASDDTEMAIQSTLDVWSNEVYFSKPELAPIGTLKSFRRSVRNGMSVYSPPAFAAAAFTVGLLFRDMKASLLLAEAAMDILDQLGDRTTEGKTLTTLASGPFYWTRPFASLKALFSRAYRSAMIAGDLQTAMFALNMHFESSLGAGDHIDTLEGLLTSYRNIASDCDKQNIERMMSVHHQMILNLQGASDHTVRIVGYAFDEDQYELMVESRETPIQRRDDAVFEVIWSGAKLTLATFFGDYRAGADIMIDLFDSVSQQFPGLMRLLSNFFMGGICCYSSYRQDPKSKKYLQMARRCRKAIKKWSSQGQPNSKPYEAILDAEDLWRRKRWSDAVHAFGEAIAKCEEYSLVHAQALTYERLGRLLNDVTARKVRLKTDVPVSERRCFEKAAMLYDTWGAMGKAEQLRQHLSSYMEQPGSHSCTPNCHYTDS